MSYTTSCSIVRHDLDKASFNFTINNFPKAKSIMKTGDEIQSIDFSIGGSKFYIGIYPNGDEHENNEFLSVYNVQCTMYNVQCTLYIHNKSDHRHKVTVDYTISIGRSSSAEAIIIKPHNGYGWGQFVKKIALPFNITVKVEATLVKEDIINSLPG